LSEKFNNARDESGSGFSKSAHRFSNCVRSEELVAGVAWGPWLKQGDCQTIAAAPNRIESRRENPKVVMGRSPRNKDKLDAREHAGFFLCNDGVGADYCG